MKLVTFENAARRRRVGAATPNGSVVDLNLAYAMYLREEGESAYVRMAGARVPPEMWQLFEGGDRSLDAAKQALQFATAAGAELAGPAGETITYERSAVKLRAPIFSAAIAARMLV